MLTIRRILLAVVLLAGCTGTTPAPPVVSSADSDGLEAELDGVLEEWLASSKAPGASLAVQLPDGSLVAVSGGVSNLATEEATDPEDLFRFASITKSMTAATVVDLAEDGLIDLDAPVADYLGSGWVADHPSAASITVRQLLNHTSGLTEYLFTSAFAAEASQRYGQPWEPAELLDFVGRQGAAFGPGERFAYNTGGFIAAGMLIEEVTGDTAAEVMRSRLFEPAGADQIHLTPQDEPTTALASGYVGGGIRQVLIAADPSIDRGLELSSGAPVVDVLAADQAGLQSASWTGGGIEATASSTASVLHAMFDGAVLGPDSVAQMIEPAAGVSYGLGIDRRTIDGATVYAHSGGTAGFVSEAGYLAEHSASFAVSANLSGVAVDLHGLLDEIVPLLIAATSEPG